MKLFNKEPKYKLYPVQKEDDLDTIHVGLFVLDETYGGYDFKFAFETEEKAMAFIPTLEQYPKFLDTVEERR